MLDESPQILSQAGRRRREEILSAAMSTARSRRRRRRALIVTRGAAALLVVWALAWWSAPRSKPPIIAQHDVNPAIAPVVGTAIDFIETDPTLVEKWGIKLDPPAARPLDDSHLLTLLAEARHPAGLAYINGEARVLYRDPQ